MLSLFKTVQRNVPIITPPRHHYINDRVDSILTKAAYTYRKTTHFVEADHILVKILQQLGGSDVTNDRIYYNQIALRTSQMAAAVGFSDYNARPNLNHKNSFFDSKVREYIVSISNGYTDLVSLDGMWQFFRPVKVLHHPYNDMTCNIRDGSPSVHVQGYAVILIDIPLLALQFHKWTQWARANLDVMPTVEQFVFQYPLVNMMPSDANVSYFNHLSAAMVGQGITPQRAKYGFSVPSVQDLIPQDVAYILEHAAKKPRNMIDLAQSIMLFDGNTIWDFLQLPNILVGTGNAGVLALGALPWVATLAQLSFQSGAKDNGFARQYLTRRMRDLRSGGYLRFNGLPTGYIEEKFKQEVLPYLS